MSEMTYKQAIKVLSEAKVADMPYNGCGNNHKMYDIARRMAIEALKEKAAAESYENSACADDNLEIPCKVGDVIPFKTRTGYVINYLVEKIKIGEDGTIKIRCKHGGGGQPRSFLASEAKALIRSGGVYTSLSLR